MTLTLQYVRDRLHYDAESGVFRWRMNTAAKPAGSRAGTAVGSNGYRRIQIAGKTILEHRLAVFYVTGEWPKDWVDHINRNRADNRICNLRDLTPQESAFNRPHSEHLDRIESAGIETPNNLPDWSLSSQGPDTLTAEILREILIYEPETGKFYWKMRRAQMLAGDEAGYVGNLGYILIGIALAGSKRRYTGHRLAWLYQTGEWPENNVDHINGSRADNRWCNLRAATQSENQANRRVKRSVANGLKGIEKHHSGRWVARICKEGRRYHLGMFDTAEEAHAVYAVCAEALHGEFARML